jgi:uncharacterized protein
VARKLLPELMLVLRELGPARIRCAATEELMRPALAIALLLLNGVSALAAAQDRPVSLYNTEYREFTSKVTGRSYAVFVALPDSYNTDASRRYPVLYTSDAHVGFPLVTYIYRLMRLTNDVPEMIIVGIAGKDLQAWNAERIREMSPTTSPSRQAELAKSLGVEVHAGEGAAFLRVFTDELIPDVERRYRAGAERLYSGHSFGALFGAYALFQSPTTFPKMILVSPSLSWDEGVVFRQEEQFAASKRPMRADVFVAVGGLESASMRENTNRFVSVLAQRKYNGLTLHSITFENETHTSVFPGAFARGLRTLFPREVRK